MLVNYLIATDPLPDLPQGVLYEYILAGNGLFLRAERAGLEAMIPLSGPSNVPVRGLPQVEPYLRLNTPKVPASALQYMLEQALAQQPEQSSTPGRCRVCGCTDEHGCPDGCFWVQDDLCSSCIEHLDVEVTPGFLEVLFYLDSLGDEWRLWEPNQVKSRLDITYTPENALIEVHSHHAMGAFFSFTDNADQTGFRIYTVLGRINTEPTLRVRVGIYGYFWDIPAGWAFELPASIQVQDEEWTKE